MSTSRKYLGLVKQAANGWVEDRAASMGAALSYYTVFSVAPLLLIVIAVAGLVFGRDAAQGAIVTQIGGLVGESSANAIQGLLQSVAEPKEGLLATLVGLVLLLVGATTVFAELQDDLNRIWKMPRQAAPSGVWGWLRSRLLSIGLIMAIGFLLLVSLAASAAIAVLGDWFGDFFKAWEPVAHAVNFLVSFGIITALFALIYRFMPQVHIEWHDVWIGAAVTSLLFTIGKYLIGLYIGKSAVASGFGAAGSLAVILVWVYYSAQIFLLGAEFTWAYAHEYGSRRAGVSVAPQAAAGEPSVPVPSQMPAAAALSVGRPPSAAASGSGGRNSIFGRLSSRFSASPSSRSKPRGKAGGFTGLAVSTVLGAVTVVAVRTVLHGRLPVPRARA